MDVPDLRQQRWQLLVLEPQGKDLLRVNRTERAQAHKLHPHSGDAQLVLCPLDAGVRQQRIHVGLLQGLYLAGLLHVGLVS